MAHELDIQQTYLDWLAQLPLGATVQEDPFGDSLLVLHSDDKIMGFNLLLTQIPVGCSDARLANAVRYGKQVLSGPGFNSNNHVYRGIVQDNLRDIFAS